MNGLGQGNSKSDSGLGEVLRMSGPASVSMLGRTLTQFVDGWMVARLGVVTISAQGMGGLLAFVPESFSIGALGVVNTFVSQNLGAGRPKRCGQYVWAGLAIVVLLSATICPLAIFARPIFAAIGHESEVQRLEVVYFRYMILAVPITMSIRVLEAFFYGLHRPSIVFAVSIIANAFNVGGNYVLIFGKFGFPAMGLRGAATASVASWCLQLTILLIVFLLPATNRRYGTWHVRAVRRKQCLEILRIGWPAGLRFMADLLTWMFVNAILIGRFGTAHLGASMIAVRYMTLSFMPTVGIGIATTALVGRHIGRGRPDLARRRAHTAMRVAMVYMGLCAIAFLVWREDMIRWFTTISPGMAEEVDPELVVRIGGRIMVCAAIFQLFDALGIVFSGALRGAGDTLWPMLVTIALSVVVMVGGGVAMVVFFPQLESIGPYIAATAYVIVLGILMAWRFESGAWRKIDLLGRRSPVPPAGPEG